MRVWSGQGKARRGKCTDNIRSAVPSQEPCVRYAGVSCGQRLNLWNGGGTQEHLGGDTRRPLRYVTEIVRSKSLGRVVSCAKALNADYEVFGTQRKVGSDIFFTDHLSKPALPVVWSRAR